jgi:hypothetical protein
MNNNDHRSKPVLNKTLTQEVAGEGHRQYARTQSPTTMNPEE